MAGPVRGSDWPPGWLDLLFARNWWRYGSVRPTWGDAAYHGFNLVEGAAWVVFAGLVFLRYLRCRRSGLEPAYALAFLTFGLTDFREAYALDSWLVWVKLVNLIVLLRLRAVVIARYYPESRLY